MERALGKRAAIRDPRVPTLRALMATRAELPPMDEWYSDIDEWGMLGNNLVGNCVAAGALHCIWQRMVYAGKSIPPFTDADAIQLYSAWTGYDPVRPETDQGTVMSAAMAAWASQGIAIPGGMDKLAAYAMVDHVSTQWLKTAIHHCGSVMLGINCPQAWVETDYLMDAPDGLSEIAGGHCVLLVGYTPTALGLEFDVISWGRRYRMTERGLLAAADEAYAVLDRDWLDADGVNPAGVDWAAAMASMALIKAA